jgi:replication factor A3
MAEMSTPRITSQYIESFVSKNVRIVGKVTQLRGIQASIDSEGVVNLILSHVRSLLNMLSGNKSDT